MASKPPPRLWIWGVYLLAITAAEVVVAVGDVRVGLGMHFGIMIALMMHATLGAISDRPLCIALILVPLARLVSFMVPISVDQPIFWFAMTSLPWFGAALLVSRAVGFSRWQVGIQIKHVPLQLGIAALGIPLGIAEYMVFEHLPGIWPSTWGVVVIAVVVLLFSGVVLELVFRGLLQSAAVMCLGPAGILFVAAIFAILHIPALSLTSVLLGLAEGLAMGWIAGSSRSIVGVGLGRGLANVLVVIVLPALLNPTQVENSTSLAPSPVIIASPRPSPSTAVPTTVVVVASSTAGAERAEHSIALTVPTPVVAATIEATPTVLASAPPPAASSSPSPTPQRAESASLQQRPTPENIAMPSPVVSATPTAEPPSSALAQAPDANQFETYIVQTGDTLSAIARDRQTTVGALVQINAIINPDLILRGQSLRVPKRPNRP
jgi:LysM repeat protein